MLPNTTSERARLEWDLVQRWKEHAEALTQRAEATLRKGYDFKIRKYNEPEHPRKKRREDVVQQAILETPALTRTPESFGRPRPESTTSGCTCCGGDRLTRAAVYVHNVLNAQAESFEPYDPYGRVRRWLNVTSIWWYKEADTDNTEKVDQVNNVAPITWDLRRTP